MPMQQVEYEFPNPDKPEKEGVDIVLEDVEEAEPELEIEGAVGRETVGTDKDKSAVAEEDGMEIEVVGATTTNVGLKNKHCENAKRLNSMLNKYLKRISN